MAEDVNEIIEKMAQNVRHIHALDWSAMSKRKLKVAIEHFCEVAMGDYWEWRASVAVKTSEARQEKKARTA